MQIKAKQKAKSKAKLKQCKNKHYSDMQIKAIYFCS